MTKAEITAKFKAVSSSKLFGSEVKPEYYVFGCTCGHKVISLLNIYGAMPFFVDCKKCEDFMNRIYDFDDNKTPATHIWSVPTLEEVIKTKDESQVNFYLDFGLKLKPL